MKRILSLFLALSCLVGTLSGCATDQKTVWQEELADLSAQELTRAEWWSDGKNAAVMEQADLENLAALLGQVELLDETGEKPGGVSGVLTVTLRDGTARTLTFPSFSLTSGTEFRADRVKIYYTTELNGGEPWTALCRLFDAVQPGA